MSSINSVSNEKSMENVKYDSVRSSQPEMILLKLAYTGNIGNIPPNLLKFIQITDKTVSGLP